ncbi:MAG: rlmD [Gammaproteobacteria bacterium]|jgi:23S rRNA (uracil1939-C5)-methyltransferase|nr:rlmD [Gammaproteobacteria bacterium]
MKITKLSHEGRGIGHDNGKTQFVMNALPGEEVTIQKLKKHSKYDEAIAIEILEPSPERVNPPCQHFLVCGGCSLQHLDSRAQIVFKENQLKEQLQHFGHCEAKEIMLPLQADVLGYRRKARLGVKYVAKKNKVLVGFRELNGRYLADIHYCPVLHPQFGNLIAPLSELFYSLSIRDQIPQVECAMGDEEAALIIRHLAPFTEEDLTQLKQFAESHNLAIFLQPKGPESIHKLIPNDENLFLTYALPNHHVTLAFHPADFTQVNTSINRQMIDQALHLLELKNTDEVLDLFCGIGNFSLPIARYAKSVLGVEGDPKMVQRATDNAKRNHLENVRFTAADLTKEFAFAKNLRINKVLIDPPRSGGYEVLPHLLALNPERIVYVSCNPSTLARDAEYLTTHGYILEKAGVMDMFPHTQHVESMALFLKKDHD